MKEKKTVIAFKVLKRDEKWFRKIMRAAMKARQYRLYKVKSV